ncbi:unnamed protein product [Sphagnum jensenii]|uniref:Uncharacterized protein n=1 Tax=Sphagnum jensenii TaxID=128206 RepID=A0ABP1B471_9BRYO
MLQLGAGAGPISSADHSFFRDQLGFFTLQYAEEPEQMRPDAGVLPMTNRCALISSAHHEFSYKKAAPILIRSGLDQTLEKDHVSQDYKYLLSGREGSDHVPLSTMKRLQSPKNIMLRDVLQPSSYNWRCSLYVKTSNNVAAAPTVDLRTMQEDSRSSSFRSQQSTSCESGGIDTRETGDTSTTSRYSNGSSQGDASTVNSKEQQARMRPSSQQHESSEENTNSDHLLNTNRECHVPCCSCTVKPSDPSSLDHSSWLRFPFNLKDLGLFGSKKTPKSIGHENHLMRHHQPPRPIFRFSETRHQTRETTANPSITASMRGATSRHYEHSCSHEEHEAVIPALRISTPRRHSYTIHSASSCKLGQQTSRVQATNISKIRERWLLFVKILKAPYGSKSSTQAAAAGSADLHKHPNQLKAAAADDHTRRQSPKKMSNAKTPNLERKNKLWPAAAAPAQYEDLMLLHAVRPKSMPAIETVRSPVLHPIAASSGVASCTTPGARLMNASSPSRIVRPGAGRTFVSPAATNSSFKLSNCNNNNKSSTMNNLKTSKSSPKLLILGGRSSSNISTSITSPMSSRNKNTSCNSNSSIMSELHSSIQGAIAHCKSSQASGQQL